MPTQKIGPGMLFGNQSSRAESAAFTGFVLGATVGILPIVSKSALTLIYGLQRFRNTGVALDNVKDH